MANTNLRVRELCKVRGITIKELAEKMKMQPSVIVKKLFLQGQMVTVNQEVSYEEAENIAIEFDIMCEQEVKVDVIEELLKEDEEDEVSYGINQINFKDEDISLYDGPVANNVDSDESGEAGYEVQDAEDAFGEFSFNDSSDESND